MLQREQEKAIALLETSPLLSYLFFTHAISAKATPDSPVSDQSEELSALKQQSEKFESELAAAQVALAEAHTIVESLREEVQQLKADMLEERSRHAVVFEEKGAENEDLRREIRKHKARKHEKRLKDVGDLTLNPFSPKGRLYRRSQPLSSSRWFARSSNVPRRRLYYKLDLMNSRQVDRCEDLTELTH